MKRAPRRTGRLNTLWALLLGSAGMAVVLVGLLAVELREGGDVVQRGEGVARLLEGEKMAPLCREFGISRVTGYKIYNRYKECGLDALYDRSRAPYRQANRLPFQVEQLIVSLKKEQPSWGAPKIREKLRRLYPDIHAPATSMNEHYKKKPLSA